MADQEREKLACAKYLGIDPKKISKVETTYDGGGHITGLKVTIHIRKERTHLRDFVNEYCPTR